MAETFQVPTSTVISKELIIDAVLFGGLGLAGTGPALTSVVTGNAMVLVFVACCSSGCLATPAHAARSATAKRTSGCAAGFVMVMSIDHNRLPATGRP